MKDQLFLIRSFPIHKVKQIIFASLLAALFLSLSLWLLQLSANTGQAAGDGAGNVVRVGSVTASRFQEDWTLDGSEMITTRIKLLSPDNFGPTGTVTFSIDISDTAATTDSINLDLLNNFDVFFIGWFEDTYTNAFTIDELNAMETWVLSGGVMIVTCDDQNHDAVCAHFGYPSLASSVSPITPTVTGTVHPIFNGPFGIVTSATLEGDMGYFTTTVGAEVLAEDVNGQPVVLEKVDGVGCGAVILMSDIDIITDYGGITPGPIIVTNNDRFLGNLFAYTGSFESPCITDYLQYIPIMRSAD